MRPVLLRLMPRTELHLPYSSYHLSSQDVPRCIIHIEVSYNLWKCVIFGIYPLHLCRFGFLSTNPDFNEKRYTVLSTTLGESRTMTSAASTLLCSAAMCSGVQCLRAMGKRPWIGRWDTVFFHHVLTCVQQQTDYDNVYVNIMFVSCSILIHNTLMNKDNIYIIIHIT